jgi:hypothetical protein
MISKKNLAFLGKAERRYLIALRRVAVYCMQRVACPEDSQIGVHLSQREPAEILGNSGKMAQLWRP